MPAWVGDTGLHRLRVRRHNLEGRSFDRVPSGRHVVTSIRIRAVLIGGLMMIFTGGLSTTASAQVVERGVQGAAVGAIIGGIVGGGRGAGNGGGIGAGVGGVRGAGGADGRAEWYDVAPPPLG